MALKTNDKTERISVRFTQEQVLFLDRLAVAYRCSISEIIRMLVNMQLYKGDI